MQYLLDTGVLLRLVIQSDPLHAQIRTAVKLLKDNGQRTVTSPQNMVEFWNVCTRPRSARGGMGLSIASAEHRMRMIERAVFVVSDDAAIYEQWKRLVAAHKVIGVQVHDARIAAAMMVHGIRQLVTLNASDFGRYPAINAVEPVEVIKMLSTSERGH